MIRRGNRFHGRGAIQRLYKAGASVRTSSLSLKYAPSNRPDYRLAVVVSKKIHKSAVVRNRIRRRIYENVRILSGSFVRPYDLLITVYDESIASIPAEKLQSDVVVLLQKAKVTSAATPDHAIVSAKD